MSRDPIANIADLFIAKVLECERLRKQVQVLLAAAKFALAPKSDTGPEGCDVLEDAVEQVESGKVRL